ncbi:DUF7352 domain-containing protein [Paenibacillus illinoisensis]|uniref:DUF7352 domain-containing protein n=1 Tax=Paenibacillus illinoisensis TaxID=59845 RepID=UPI003015EDDF
MKRIFHYPLTTDGFQTIYMPIGSQILSVIMQQGVISLYAIVDETEILEPREFAVWGTGWVIEDELDHFRFISTLTHEAFGTSLVWHIFEKVSPAEPMKNGDCPVCGGVRNTTEYYSYPFETKCVTCGFHSTEESDGSIKIELGGEEYLFAPDNEGDFNEALYDEYQKTVQKVLEGLE